ncbi:MAG: peptide chain release factor N(5)-glutamine methyltransferase [Saprospiraceae bacterium]|nr:peptide chain release factor N(5)-glutamine methyltransferase [Saprospiraceae bacterium]
MPIQSAIQDLVTSLTPQCGDREAASISRWLFDDYFGIKAHNPNDELMFTTFLRTDFLSIKKRLLNGEPIQYITGFAWFYGLKFKVNPNVLIPRPETEELVEWVLQTVGKRHNVQILDIGTGSGCIPVTLKIKNPSLSVSAVDISEGALITASRNAYRQNADVTFQRLNILNMEDWGNLGNFNIIVSNPPYILTAEKALMERNVLAFEPELALFVEDDNALIFYENIAEFAKKHFYTEGGTAYLFFECNQYNALEVVQVLQKKGFADVQLRKDMSGNDRMIRAKWVNNG